jgi:hypothetical protein
MANQITDADHARILAEALYKSDADTLAIKCMHCEESFDTNQTVTGYALAEIMLYCWGTSRRRDGEEGALCPGCVDMLTGEVAM